ncbi:MAG: polysaccharide biosynthesis tyrosine autokinase [Bacteroidales bacterium]|nr:polysaccharide biosynthesis tyrosine autokinase [Bacteroidales bacterium]
MPANERELADIKRLYELNDAVYTSMLQKYAEAEISMASNLPDNSVIERAHMVGDSPIAPKKKVNIILGIFMGFIIPISIMIFKEVNHEKILEEREIEKYSSYSVVGSVYHNDTKSLLPMLDAPQSAISESIRSIRANLQYYKNNNNNQLILLTSSTSREGKSLTSLNLAASYAIGNYKTLLIGFDLRKPVLNDYLEIKSTLGVSSYLINAATLDDIIVKTEHPSLDYIPSGAIPPNPSELIDSMATKAFLEHVRGLYDHIIVDTAPLGLVADSYSLMQYADVCLFLVRRNVTPISLFAKVMEEVEFKGITNLAHIYNDVSGKERSHGYKYGYYHKSKK